jgi:hypothetical protein
MTWTDEKEVLAMLQSFQVIEVNVMVFKKPEDAYFEILCPPPVLSHLSACR